MDDLIAFRRDLIAFLRARLDEEAQRTAYCAGWRRDEFETGPILELLARPCTDHDDYQETWKP